MIIKSILRIKCIRIQFIINNLTFPINYKLNWYNIKMYYYSNIYYVYI